MQCVTLVNTIIHVHYYACPAFSHVQYKRFLEQAVEAYQLPGNHILCSCKTVIDMQTIEQAQVKEPEGVTPAVAGLKYVCVCVCILCVCVCVCVCIHACVCFCMFVCVHAWSSVCGAHVWLCVCSCMQAWFRVCVHLCVYSVCYCIKMRFCS